MARPMETAFALVGLQGFCATAAQITDGIHAAARSDPKTVEAWVSLGECINRIAAQQTVH